MGRAFRPGGFSDAGGAQEMGEMGVVPAEAQAVLDFWFRETEPEKWFKRDDAFDATVRARFADLHARATAGDCDGWAATPRGCLALVVLLDQFPRNMFRGEPPSFATDAAACALTKLALDRGFDADLSLREKQFLYMPLQHSEDAADQALSVERNGATGDAELLKYAEAHKRIVDRFGRFPHRNDVLGRATTPEEAGFLAQPGSSF
jgi:uncharacterized protein (DUF924 family)